MKNEKNETAEFLFAQDRERFMADYQAAVDYILELTKMGVGVRPVTFLIASHQEISNSALAEENERLKAEQRIKKLEQENERLEQRLKTSIAAGEGAMRSRNEWKARAEKAEAKLSTPPKTEKT